MSVLVFLCVRLFFTVNLEEFGLTSCGRGMLILKKLKENNKNKNKLCENSCDGFCGHFYYCPASEFCYILKQNEKRNSKPLRVTATVKWISIQCYICSNTYCNHKTVTKFLLQ